MIYLLCFVVAWLLGRGVLRAFYRKPNNQDADFADAVLAGGLVIIGLTEAAHLVTVVSGRPFSDCVKLFLTGLVLLLLVAAVLVVVKPRGETKRRAFAGDVIFFLFGAMVLIQLLQLVTEQRIYSAGDMTVETVNSILSTNAVYQVNPLTGQPYTAGIPMRLKILCLPTLYAILCDIFGISGTQMVWNVAPVLTLVGSYLAFSTVAKALFPDEGRKRGIFMVLVALLLWVGDYLYGMDGFAVQYAGYRGVSIRMAILLPYTFGLILRKKWILVLLCILAEACIVWTLYGMGVCLAVTVGMLLAGIFQKKRLEEGDL